MEMQTDCLGMLLWSPSAAPALAGRCCTGSSHWAISEPLKAPQELESSLELRVSILSFWSLQCVCCVSATSSWRCSCLSCCLNTANKGVLYHLIKKTKQLQTKTSSISGTAWGLLLPLRDGRGKGRHFQHGLTPYLLNALFYPVIPFPQKCKSFNNSLCSTVLRWIWVYELTTFRDVERVPALCGKRKPSKAPEKHPPQWMCLVC